MNYVRTIKVGGEYHSVEDNNDTRPGSESDLLPVVGNLTETCDGCGAGGQDAVFVLIRDAVLTFPAYECAGCKRQYTVYRSHPRDTVFYP